MLIVIEGCSDDPDAMSLENSATADAAIRDVSVAGNSTDAGQDAAIVADARVAATSDAGSTVATALSDFGLNACGTPAGLAKFKPSNVDVVGLAAAKAYELKYACTIDTDTLGVTCSFDDIPSNLPIQLAGAAPNEVALLYIESLTLTTRGELNIVGKRPFVLVATDKIVNSGAIRSVASKTNGYAGGGAPGASTANRNGFGPGAGMGGTDAAGAVGASFCGLGGAGGGGGTVAAPYGTPELVPLVGGSSGGSKDGGSGAGGGAVQLVAGRSISLEDTGLITMPGYSTSGFSAGGSGGAILLEAPELIISGTLAVNGATAGDYYGGTEGSASNEPAKGEFITQGIGTAATKIDGSAPTKPKESGGGGAGRIRLNSLCPATLGAASLITPSITTMCYSTGKLSAR